MAFGWATRRNSAVTRPRGSTDERLPRRFKRRKNPVPASLFFSRLSPASSSRASSPHQLPPSFPQSPTSTLRDLSLTSFHLPTPPHSSHYAPRNPPRRRALPQRLHRLRHAPRQARRSDRSDDAVRLLRRVRFDASLDRCRRRCLLAALLQGCDHRRGMLASGPLPFFKPTSIFSLHTTELTSHSSCSAPSPPRPTRSVSSRAMAASAPVSTRAFPATASLPTLDTSLEHTTRTAPVTLVLVMRRRSAVERITSFVRRFHPSPFSCSPSFLPPPSSLTSPHPSILKRSELTPLPLRSLRPHLQDRSAHSFLDDCLLRCRSFGHRHRDEAHQRRRLDL